jgi:S1-C subfamily serine protease
MSIVEIEKDGPSAKAGVQRGFVLTGIAGQPARNLRTVGDILSGSKTGDSVELSIIVARRVSSAFLELRQGAVEVRVR